MQTDEKNQFFPRLKTSMGLRHGDTIRIGYYIKSTVLGKGLVFDLKIHGMNNPVTEPIPDYTPEIP